MPMYESKHQGQPGVASGQQEELSELAIGRFGQIHVLINSGFRE